jgi:hypothetical protein
METRPLFICLARAPAGHHSSLPESPALLNINPHISQSAIS